MFKHAQFLHRILLSGTTSNIALKICSVLKNCLSIFFSVSDPVTKEDVVDRFGNQWLLFRKEDLPEHWYLNTNGQ